MAGACLTDSGWRGHLGCGGGASCEMRRGMRENTHLDLGTWNCVVVVTIILVHIHQHRRLYTRDHLRPDEGLIRS